ncbi:MAG TPA: hypothetical protein VK729_11820, partial [Silvibacterium sp.]|nr:hypothetical protein [Silvibacterium sp.]
FDYSLLFVLTIVPTANAQRFTVTTIPSPPNATPWLLMESTSWVQSPGRWISGRTLVPSLHG